MKVSAKDKATGKEQEIRIQASGGLDDSEIDRMVAEAEANAESDKERRAEVETRNQAEALVHGAEKAIDDLGDKADPQAKRMSKLVLRHYVKCWVVMISNPFHRNQLSYRKQ